MRVLLRVVVTVGLSAASFGSTLAAAQPAIHITSLPAYGTNELMSGVVSGVDVTAFRVASYIYIDGGGWWTKPTDQTPTVPIANDGSFAANVTTGGLDARATILCAALIPASQDPPRAFGARRVPAALNQAALDCRERYGRTISFAGRTWAVKDAPLPVGPGSNTFSDQSSDVWVDDAGLHLTIHYRDGRWWSSEVVLLDSLGYGTYAFQTDSETANLDVNATLGLFTWDAYGDDEASGDSHNREIDIEDSRWGSPTDPNSQYVVQPWNVAGNRHRFNLPTAPLFSTLTRSFTWKPSSVRFLTLSGAQSPHNFPPSSVIDDWTYLHQPGGPHYVPRRGRERIHLNLWLNAQPAPANGQPVEVIISSFSFTPAVDGIDLDRDGANDVLLQHSPSNYTAAWLMNRSGQPTAFTPVWWADAGDWRIGGTTDINRDSTTDIVLYHRLTGEIYVWPMNRSGQPTGFVHVDGVLPAGTWKVVATADLNGDLVNDIVVQDAATGFVGVLIFQCCGATANFQWVYQSATSGWQVVGAADLDDDGICDLLLQHGSSAQVGVWTMNRTGQPVAFRFVWAYSTNGWKVAGTSDLNDDGIADVLLQHSATSEVAGWLLDAAGVPQSFVWVWPYSTGGWLVKR